MAGGGVVAVPVDVTSSESVVRFARITFVPLNHPHAGASLVAKTSATASGPDPVPPVATRLPTSTSVSGLPSKVPLSPSTPPAPAPAPDVQPDVQPAMQPV